MVVTWNSVALGARFRVPSFKSLFKVVVGALECSGFFEAPMSPLLHGSTPVGEVARKV